MRNVAAIATRELKSYFVSPLAYVVIALFLLVTGYFFDILVFLYSRASLQAGMNPFMAEQLNLHDGLIRPLYANLHIILMLVVPLVSMRLLAEEKRQGTAELLLTAPVKTSELVLGKYLGAMTFLAILIILTAQYPLFIWGAGAKPPLAAYLSAVLGALFLTAAFLAVGLLMSSLTENQIVAAVGSFVANLVLWLIHFMADRWPGKVGEFLESLSLLQNTEEFAKGVIDTRPVVFFAGFIAFSLFLTQRVLDSRRWR
jgi:ABC-2 type transport system permease protein